MAAIQPLVSFYVLPIYLGGGSKIVHSGQPVIVS